MAYGEAVVFVETPVFTRRVQEYLEDDEYAELQAFLNARPGRGKRGGLRVIYYWWVAKDRISLLMVYPKSERDDLTADQLKQLRSQLAP